MPPAISGPALWFLFQNSRLLVRRVSGRVEVPLLTTPADLGLFPSRSLYFGYVQTSNGYTNCIAAELNEETDAPPDFTFETLRPLYSQLDERTFWLAGRAVQIVDWDRTSQYCGRCGRETIVQTHDRSRYVRIAG